MPQPGIEHGDLIGRHPFLRPEYGRGAERAAERILHIGHQGNRALLQAGIETREVDPAQGGQTFWGRCQRVVGRIEQAHTECRQQAGAAVVGAASAQAEHEPAHALVEAMP